jgi:lipid II:glycine glycyltransferase (peptidoglycan interpeptide bridge formation enzyme)
VTNKEKYRGYCQKHSLALYQNDWWLDAVCGNDWDVSIIEKDGKVVAALAYPYRKKYGLKLIQMPMLTLGLGPVGTAFEFGQLEKHLPKFDLLDLYFLFQFTSFKWEGFDEKLRHTHHIPDLSDLEKIFKAFASSTRQQIRKAERSVTVHASEDIETLYKMVSMTFKRQKKKTPYTLAYVKRINDACAQRDNRKILVAKDQEGNVHGACFLAWDKETAYYVMGGSDPKYKSSAAYSLLMWEAIKEASKHSRKFDFCGSSIPSVSKFFSGFGSVRVPYLHLKKVNSKALRLMLKLKGV